MSLWNKLQSVRFSAHRQYSSLIAMILLIPPNHHITFLVQHRIFFACCLVWVTSLAPALYPAALILSSTLHPLLLDASSPRDTVWLVPGTFPISSCLHNYILYWLLLHWLTCCIGHGPITKHLPLLHRVHFCHLPLCFLRMGKMVEKKKEQKRQRHVCVKQQFYLWTHLITLRNKKNVFLCLDQVK